MALADAQDLEDGLFVCGVFAVFGGHGDVGLIVSLGDLVGVQEARQVGGAAGNGVGARGAGPCGSERRHGAGGPPADYHYRTRGRVAEISIVAQFVLVRSFPVSSASIGRGRGPSRVLSPVRAPWRVRTRLVAAEFVERR